MLPLRNKNSVLRITFQFNGMPSFAESSFFAFVNTLDLSTNSFSSASLPSRSKPLGTLPSGHMPFSCTTLSFSSLRVLNIFIIFDMALTLLRRMSASKQLNILVTFHFRLCLLFNYFLRIGSFRFIIIWEILTHL